MAAVITSRLDSDATSSSETSVIWRTRDTRFCVSHVDPFGDILSSFGVLAGGNTFRFSTKYHDDEPDTVYYGSPFGNADLEEGLDAILRQHGMRRVNLYFEDVALDVP